MSELIALCEFSVKNNNNYKKKKKKQECNTMQKFVSAWFNLFWPNIN